MALIKFGGGVAAISGKIAGTVFARNKAGAYARNWAKPVNPVTPSQAEVRALFQTASAGWNALSSSERDSWNSAASSLERINRFGETYKPSGRQYFMEIMNSLGQAGQATFTDPPISPVPPAAIVGAALTATAVGGALTVLSLAWTSPSAGMVIIIEAAPPTPDTKTNVNTMYRQIKVATAGGSPETILTEYASIFGGSAAAGDIIRARLTVLDFNTGYRSAQILVADVV